MNMHYLREDQVTSPPRDTSNEETYSSLKVSCIVCVLCAWKQFECLPVFHMVARYCSPHQNRFMRFISCFLSEELMVFIPLGVHNRIKSDYEYCNYL